MQKISIAIATYNGEEYILQLLQSVCSQTLLPQEIVVLDDQSTDGTVTKILDYSQKSKVKFIVAVNIERLGYRQNFLRAAAMCSSDLIAFCDQDDIWLPEKLEKCSAAFVHRNVLMCYHAASVINDLGEVTGKIGEAHPPSCSKSAYNFQSYWNNPYGFTQIFRKELINYSHLHKQSIDHRSKLGEPLAHDQWICFISSSIGEIAYVPDELVLYRQHQGNIVGYVKASGWRHRWAAAALWGEKQYNRVSLDASRRAEILRNVVLENAPADMTLARKSAMRYEALSLIYRKRALLFRASNLWGRAAVLLKMLFTGVYLNANGGRFGASALLKDMVFGVVRLGRFTKYHDS